MALPTFATALRSPNLLNHKSMELSDLTYIPVRHVYHVSHCMDVLFRNQPREPLLGTRFLAQARDDLQDSVRERGDPWGAGAIEAEEVGEKKDQAGEGGRKSWGTCRRNADEGMMLILRRNCDVSLGVSKWNRRGGIGALAAFGQSASKRRCRQAG